jgi:uncharacterized membrane protein (DUF4010 family)
MPLIDHVVLRFAVALGIGLLIGTERERNQGSGHRQEVAGVRTFALTSLTGAVSLQAGDELIFIAFGLIVGLLIVVGYRNSHDTDPGMTTEIAQLATFLLGGLAMRQPQLAAGLGVAVALLLASRPGLHKWIHDVLTDDEIRDGLLLAAAALIILPLTPEEPVDRWGVINLRRLWTLAVVIMAINGLGYVALRVLGPKIGLALAGFFSGFVSSTATIGAMGARAKKYPDLRWPAVAGAAFSSVATVLQLALVVALASTTLLRELALPLLAAGMAAALYATLFALRTAHESGDREAPAGRPFDPKIACIFVVIVGVVLIASALLTQWLGDRGLLLASAVSGLADAHAAAFSAASLAANESVPVNLAAMAVLAGFSSNALSKIFVAFSLGDRRYAMQLVPGILLGVGAAWATLVGAQLLD